MSEQQSQAASSAVDERACAEQVNTELVVDLLYGRARCGICGGDHDAYSALCPEGY